jgi:hypothetical protein
MQDCLPARIAVQSGGPEGKHSRRRMMTSDPIRSPRATTGISFWARAVAPGKQSPPNPIK